MFRKEQKIIKGINARVWLEFMLSHNQGMVISIRFSSAFHLDKGVKTETFLTTQNEIDNFRIIKYL
jgi:GTP cyclohydrolase III